MDRKRRRLSARNGKITAATLWGLVFAFGFATFVGAYIFFFREQIVASLKGPDAGFTSYEGTRFPSELKVRSQNGSRESFDEIFARLPERSVILNLWATWCEPCVRELPIMVKALPALRARGIEIVLVNYDGANPDTIPREVGAWLANEKLPFTTWYDFDNALTSRLKIGGLPVSIGVDPEKNIRWVRMGEIDWLDETQTRVVQ